MAILIPPRYFFDAVGVTRAKLLQQSRCVLHMPHFDDLPVGKSDPWRSPTISRCFPVGAMPLNWP